MDCEALNQQRAVLMNALSDIAIFKNFDTIHNIKYWLFPHLLYPKNVLRKQDNIQERAMILKFVAYFIMSSYES